LNTDGSNQKDSKATEIASVALRLFSQRGYDGTSMLDIARGAGVGKSTLYDYFTTKEALFKAATHVWVRARVTGLREFLDGFDDPLRQLREIANYVATAVNSHQEQKVCMMLEFLRQTFIEGGALYQQSTFLLEEMREAPKIIEEVLLQGVAQGVFKPQVAPTAGKLAVNLIAFLDGIVFRWILVKESISIRDQISLYIENLVSFCRVPPDSADTGGLDP
jgi:AcrR family transcriptional regulator